jgi:hypothetical protein
MLSYSLNGSIRGIAGRRGPRAAIVPVMTAASSGRSAVVEQLPYAVRSPSGRLQSEAGQAVVIVAAGKARIPDRFAASMPGVAVLERRINPETRREAGPLIAGVRGLTVQVSGARQLDAGTELKRASLGCDQGIRLGGK